MNEINKILSKKVQDKKSGTLVGRLLTEEEVCVINGAGGENYTQSGDGTFTQCGGSYTQDSGSYNMECTLN